jgi:hypothetical protein
MPKHMIFLFILCVDKHSVYINHAHLLKTFHYHHRYYKKLDNVFATSNGIFCFPRVQK